MSPRSPIYNYIIYFTVLFFLSAPGAQSLAPSDDVPTLFVDQQLQEASLTFYTQRFTDDTGQLSVYDVAQHGDFEPVLEPSQLHLGYYSGNLWLRNIISNTDDARIVKVLSFDYANIDQVTLHVFDDSGRLVDSMTSGTHVSLEQRPLKNRHASFPITIPAESRVVIYSQLQSNGSMTAYQRLYSPQQYDATYSIELYWLALYCGMLLALGLYNFLLFGALKQSVFLRYSLFVISFLFGTLAMNGLGAQFFWDHQTLNINRLMAFSFCAAGFTATLFVRKYLALKYRAPLWHRITFIPLFVSGAGLLGALVLSPQTALKLSDINGITAGVVLLSCGIACLIKQVPGAKIFVIAWSLLLSGACIHAFRNLGVLPTNFVSLYGMQIGSAIEMLLLSFAIAAKFNQLKHEKHRAQSELITVLKTNETQLEQKIEQRTYELQQMAYHDGLTGLLNRHGLNKALATAIARCKRNGALITLVMLDLDAFKPINDEFGHDAGDRVLRQIAQRLLTCVRGYDTVARFGGDEFLIVCESLANEAEAQTFIERVREKICQPIQVNGTTTTVISASVGFYQHHADVSVNTLLKEADKAMYRVKYAQRGKLTHH